MATLLEPPLVYDFDVNRHLHIPDRKVRILLDYLIWISGCNDTTSFKKPQVLPEKLPFVSISAL